MYILCLLNSYSSVTSRSVSEFNTKTTRDTWLDLVRENISRWKKLDDDEDELENVISLIKGVTVARKAGAPAKDKQSKKKKKIEIMRVITDVYIRRHFKHHESKFATR